MCHKSIKASKHLDAKTSKHKGIKNNSSKLPYLHPTTSERAYR
ncbi:hypothetical protein IAE16_03715 [Hydrogenobacter sp. T-2]|nr:hypothetical protein [Hydrogenobacter sp. T-2]WPM32793.1 hypothetical protein IAE16_03715 [Hydrogenobacter sp. T-2]